MLRMPKPRRNASDAPPLEDMPSPLGDFFKQDSTAALILLASAILALVIANSPWGYAYHEILHSDFALSLGLDMEIRQDLHHWVNDGLMCIFFFLVGLEIKREVLVGELASLRRATLPGAAALGGMLVPALMYLSVNYGSDSALGWGIPMATDIAFAMGCIALLGGRVPSALAVFVVALAIVDDLGAVTVIALFYTDHIEVFPLVEGACLIALSFFMNWMGVRNFLPYALVGAVIWFLFLQSGVHATIAGVLLAFTIPPDARYRSSLFSSRMTKLVNDFETAQEHEDSLYVNAAQQRVIRKMTQECHHVEAPLQRLEYNLHPLSVFVIMPIFAFANSGVTLPLAEIGGLLLEPVTLGIILGLVVGKPLGITLFSWLAVKLNIAELPSGVTWPQMVGVSFLAGIGFTMSLFINDLAFKRPGPPIAHAAVDAAVESGLTTEMALRYTMEGKLGIFVASIIAGVAGLLILRAVTNPPDPNAPKAAPRH